LASKAAASLFFVVFFFAMTAMIAENACQRTHLTPMRALA
jgi:hypothetical protein